MSTDGQTSHPRSVEDLIYSNVEPLDVQRHAKLGMMRDDTPYGFAAKQHYVPLQVGEFGRAAIDYPIIFAGEERVPMAMLGITAGQNLFIDAAGGFRAGAYIPAFLRRYPFAAALNEPANRLFIFIDRSFHLFTEDNPEVPLFEAGQPTEFTNSCIEFCRRYDADTRTTHSFARRLADLDLFEIRRVAARPRQAVGTAAEPQLIAEYHAVSEERLKTLAPEKFAALRDEGMLLPIYAHLMSLLSWERLIEETVARSSGGPVA